MLGIASAFEQEWLREPLRYADRGLGARDPRDRLQRRHVRALAARLLARAQPPDPVAPRPAAPPLQHADRADRARRAARDRARAADRPRAARRDLRVRRDARVHARPPLGDPAALPRAGPRPALQDPVRPPDRPRRAAAHRGARRGDVRRRVRLRARACTTRRASSAPAGWRSASRSTSRTARSRASRCSSASRCPRGRSRARRCEAEFGSILVPVLGTPLDDDIMQTAGRLAGEENEDVGEGGAVIEALWVFEVPMALPLDTRVSDSELAPRAQGARARQGGGGGVRGRRGRDRDRARAPRGRGDRARGQAARRRGDRARRRGADRRARRALARRQAGPARLVRGGDDALRAAEGAVPRDPHRAAVGQGGRRPDAAVGRVAIPEHPARASRRCGGDGSAPGR